MINKSETGLWEGVLDNKVGKFKFINVQMMHSVSGMGDSSCDDEGAAVPRNQTQIGAVSELLTKMQLEVSTGVIVIFNIPLKHYVAQLAYCYTIL